MNTKPTRMLFAAFALSALAAVLASSAQARLPEGNGTKPPQGSRTFFVASEQQAPQGSGTFFVDPEIYSALTSPAVVNEQQASQGAGLLEPRLARHKSGTFFVDSSQQAGVREKLGEIGAWAVPSSSLLKPQLLQQTSVREKLGEIGAWASLDPAIKGAILARSK